MEVKLKEAMGQVKQAIIEVEDFVAGCLRQGRTLNQTIRDARESKVAAKTNPYFDDEDLVENKYYQFKGAE